MIWGAEGAMMTLSSMVDTGASCLADYIGVFHILRISDAEAGNTEQALKILHVKMMR